VKRKTLQHLSPEPAGEMQLVDGSRVAIVGGGPAGTLAGYFLMQMAHRIDLDLAVDLYEPRDYARNGPAGCNMCGGIVSESLVQLLAVEGINLPPGVVRQGIESYVLHTDQGSARIELPLREMRIAALYRASGPKGGDPAEFESFDGFLLDLARGEGVTHIPARVTDISRDGSRPLVTAKERPPQSYDLLIGAFGVNSRASELFGNLGLDLRPPKTCKTYVGELRLGRDKVRGTLGSAMHAFLLDIPKMEFAALIPKDDYVTICILGDDTDVDLVNQFMTSAPVTECLGAEWKPDMMACKCFPRINVGSGRHTFADRVVLLGDCGVSRLYKDGIGAAYRVAKACAVTAICQGVAERDFEHYYWRVCRRMIVDNTLGKLLFGCSIFAKKLGFLQRAMLDLVRREQNAQGKRRTMSTILWDMFTGSAPYGQICLRAATPDFIPRFALACVRAILRPGASTPRQTDGTTHG